MMPFRSTKVVALLACIAVCAAALLYSTLWAIFARERATLVEEALSSAAAVVEHAEYVALGTLLAETAPKRARADALFVEAGGAPTFLEALEQAGIQAGVRTIIVNVAQNEGVADKVDVLKRAGVGELVVTLEGKGGFAAVLHFLAFLETLPRPGTLTRASVSQGEGGAWSGLFELRVLQNLNL